VRLEVAFKLEGGPSAANAHPKLRAALRQFAGRVGGVAPSRVTWLGAADGPAGAACADQPGSWVLAALRIHADTAVAVTTRIDAVLANGTAADSVRILCGDCPLLHQYKPGIRHICFKIIFL
jgi:hypothetical protein